MTLDDFFIQTAPPDSQLLQIYYHPVMTFLPCCRLRLKRRQLWIFQTAVMGFLSFTVMRSQMSVKNYTALCSKGQKLQLAIRKKCHFCLPRRIYCVCDSHGWARSTVGSQDPSTLRMHSKKWKMFLTLLTLRLCIIIEKWMAIFLPFSILIWMLGQRRATWSRKHLWAHIFNLTSN